MTCFVWSLPLHRHGPGVTKKHTKWTTKKSKRLGSTAIFRSLDRGHIATIEYSSDGKKASWPVAALRHIDDNDDDDDDDDDDEGGARGVRDEL